MGHTIEGLGFAGAVADFVLQRELVDSSLEAACSDLNTYEQR
jgi:hypothetical protein